MIFDYLSKKYNEVDYKSFYRDIFPVGSFQKKGEFAQGKYNGIVVEVSNEVVNDKPKVYRHTITDDLDVFDELIERDNFCLMSPIGYVGKRRLSSNGRLLYALVFDVDGLIVDSEDGSLVGLENLIHQYEDLTDRIPKPTYIVSSGTGVHLYYVFKKPIPMFENIMDQLERLKRQLTFFMWHDTISTLTDEIQYEPVSQGFRVVGTITKRGTRTKAFKVGSKVDIEYLNQFVYKENRVTEFAYKSDLTLSKAKEKYPQWYNERIVKKMKKGTWQFDRAVYDKWLSRIQNESKVGHRYWTIWVLAVTAMKCGIKQKELERDAFGLIEHMNSLANANQVEPFTREDVLAALEGYDPCWFTYPIEKMSYRSAIELKKNRRNYRSQKNHIKYMNNQRAFKVEMGECTNGGRPSKKDIVQEWQLHNPEGLKVDCIKETGLSKKTVYKWWRNSTIKSFINTL